MSTLSSSSTDAEIFNAFDDNASFEEDVSTSKASTFITACRILLRRQPKMTSYDGTSVEFNTSFIKSELDRATRWLNNRRSAGSVRHLSAERLRD